VARSGLGDKYTGAGTRSGKRGCGGNAGRHRRGEHFAAGAGIYSADAWRSGRGFIQQWLQLAAADPDARRRSEYTLARVFAQAAGCFDVWNQALKGWNVVESIAVREWQAQAVAELLVNQLTAKFGPVPQDQTEAIRGTTDLAILKRWGILAVESTSLDQFR
jgi:hypothetical protein